MSDEPDPPDDPGGARDRALASSAGAPPPPLPPPPPDPPEAPAARRRRLAGGPRGAPDVSLAVEGGVIAFYASKQAFQATCDNPLHGRCVLTRSKEATGALSADGHPKGGRPLGQLLGWLAGNACGSKAEHWSHDAQDPPRDERRVRRVLLQDSEEGLTLLSKERDQAPGEDLEPLECLIFKATRDN